MALTPENKTQLLADILFKEFMAGKASSSELNAFFEELINSKQIIFPSQIITQEELIPQTASAVPNVIEKVTDLVLIPVPGANSRAFYHPNLVGTIPFNFGDGTSYIYGLKKQDNSVIPFGQNDWFFNPHAGVLYFMDGFPGGVSAAQPPKISCYRYIGARGFNNPTIETYNSVKTIASDPSILGAVYGDRYLIGLGPSGAWIGKQGQIAEKKNVNFSYTIPTNGATLKVDDEDGRIYHHEGDYIPGTYSWVRYNFSSVRIAPALGVNNYVGFIDPPLIEHDFTVLLIAIFSISNTGNCTFDPNGLGAKPIKINNGSGVLIDVPPGKIQPGMISFLWYDGTNYQLWMSEPGPPGQDGASTIGNIVTSVATPANTLSTTLMSVTVPAGKVSADGDHLKVLGLFSLAANANNKQIKITYPGNTHTYATAGTGLHIMEADISRISATTFQALIRLTTPTTSQTFGFVDNQVFDFNNAFTVSLIGQNTVASAGDITAQQLTVDYFKKQV